MPGSLQNKLQQHEVAPPPAVWEKISMQLDNEFVAGDTSISLKLDNTVIAPPAGIWNKIADDLHGNDIPEKHKRTNVIPLIYKKIAVAALVIGAVALAGLYFFNTDTVQNRIVQTVPAKQTAPSVEQHKIPAIATDSTSSPVALAKSDNKLPRKKISPEPAVTEEIIDYSSSPEPNSIPLTHRWYVQGGRIPIAR